MKLNTKRTVLVGCPTSFVRHADNSVEAKKGLEAFDFED